MNFIQNDSKIVNSLSYFFNGYLIPSLFKSFFLIVPENIFRCGGDDFGRRGIQQDKGCGRLAEMLDYPNLDGSLWLRCSISNKRYATHAEAMTF